MTDGNILISAYYYCIMDICYRSGFDIIMQVYFQEKAYGCCVILISVCGPTDDGVMYTLPGRMRKDFSFLQLIRSLASTPL